MDSVSVPAHGRKGLQNDDHQCRRAGLLTRPLGITGATIAFCAFLLLVPGGAYAQAGDTVPGLFGEYFDDDAFTMPVLERIDPEIDFDWGMAQADPAVDGETFSIRWTGYVTAPTTGQYTFFTVSDDASRIYIHDQKILDTWSGPCCVSVASDPVHLDAGVATKIQVDHREDFGAAVMRLSWDRPDGVTEVVPASVLSTDAGLLATYHGDETLTHPVMRRVEAQIDHDWGAGSPDSALGADHFSARWTGLITAPTTGTYTLHTKSDDGARIHIAGATVLDDWNEHAASEMIDSTAVNLEAGVPTEIVIEYFEASGDASMQLRWSGPGFDTTGVPSSALTPADRPTIQGGSDQNPPTIDAHAPVIVEATGTGGATATFTAPSASDPQGGVTVSCTPASGSVFPLGTNQVTCTATDDAGNTALEHFAVQVVDTQVPTLDRLNVLAGYYDNPLITGFAGSADVPDMDDYWGEGAPLPGMGVDDFSVRYTSMLLPPVTGEYVLHTQSDNHDRVFLDGALVIDDWFKSHDKSWHSSPPIQLEAGLPVPIVLEMSEGAGLAFIHLTWTLPDGTEETIPPTAFTHLYGAEAAGPDGASVAFDAPTYSDIADGTGDATCTPASGSVFPLGTTTVSCEAVDASGNVGDSMALFVEVVDTTAPVLLVGDVLAEATGPDGATVAFSATWTDAVDGTGDAPCDATSGDLFPLGTTTVACTHTDAHGNTGTASFDVTVVDTTAPDLTLPGDIVVEATGTDGATITFGTTWTDAVDGSGDATCTPSSGSVFPLGTTLVACGVTDGSGNTAEGSFDVQVVDATPPTADQAAVFAEYFDNNDLTGFVGSAYVPDIDDHWGLGAPLADMHPDHYSVRYTSALLPPVTGEYVLHTQSDNNDRVFLDGALVIDDWFKSQDKSWHSTPVQLEAGLPVPIVVEMSEGTFHAFIHLTWTLPDGTNEMIPPEAFTRLFSAEATGPDGANVPFDEPSYTDIADGSGDTTCTPAPGAVFAVGLTSVDCQAIDQSGNVGDHTTIHVMVVDTTAPEMTVPPDLVAEATGPDGASVPFSATWTDVVDGNGDAACDAASGTVFPLGTTTVTCSATDAHGNTGTASFDVTVVDTTAPELSVPEAIVAEATGPDGATVGFNATWTDAVDGDGDGDADCDAASGVVFPLGTTTISCSATDTAGNTGTAGFHVTVVDTTAPDVTVPEDIVVEATGAGGAAVSFSATWTDAVDGSGAAACDLDSGAKFPLGTTTVTCAATDGAGNTGMDTFLVNVVDTTPPVIAAHPDRTYPATEPGAGQVDYAAPATDDVVDGAGTATCTPPSGSALPVGAWTVTCTATDAAGNAAEPVTFNVTVTDDLQVTISPDNDGEVPLQATTYGADISVAVPGVSMADNATLDITLTQWVGGKAVDETWFTLFTDDNGTARLEIPVESTLVGEYTIHVAAIQEWNTGEATATYARIAV